MTASSAWQSLAERSAELKHLASVTNLLAWDQETYMPKNGTPPRAGQMAVLAGLRHERLTDPRVGEWLAALDGAPLDAAQAAVVRELSRAYRRASRLPGALVRALAEAQAEGFTAWAAAREAGGPGFAAFVPALTRLLDLTREMASLLGDFASPYDALLEEFEPGQNVASLRPLLGRLREETVRVLDAIRGGREPSPSMMEGLVIDVAEQDAFFHEVLSALGFDFQSGRLDKAEHPFSVGIAAEDVRITTRRDPRNFWGALFAAIHEAGHGMYEQGWAPEHRGTWLAEAPSFGLHESQSRFWENLVARSRPFLGWLLTRMQRRWPGRFDAWTADALYADANRVRPSLIRVEADEVTYNLHIAIRFEIEVELVEGRLQVTGLPEAWNAKYSEILGILPTDDKQGVLQDVHWSHGAFGYFPSYTLGNLYSASFLKVMESELPSAWDAVGRGEFGPVLGFLRQRIHAQGRLLEPADLVAQLCPGRDPVRDLAEHFWTRHGALYGVSPSTTR
jgi:carboxypeptidase Taq